MDRAVLRASLFQRSHGQAVHVGHGLQACGVCVCECVCLCVCVRGSLRVGRGFDQGGKRVGGSGKLHELYIVAGQDRSPFTKWE
jgi:hypothetical protein